MRWSARHVPVAPLGASQPARSGRLATRVVAREPCGTVGAIRTGRASIVSAPGEHRRAVTRTEMITTRRHKRSSGRSTYNQLRTWPVRGRDYTRHMDQERLLSSLSDDELLRRLLDILRRAQRIEADLVEHIAEVDARRLYAREAAPSMFAYCTEVLHLSEAEAYLRIAVARASRRHPSVLRLLREGRLHLSGIALLAPHLTVENSASLLGRAVHKSKREIEELIASVAPRPDVPASIRRLPEPKKGLTRVLAVPASSWPIRPPSSVSGRPLSGHALDNAPQPAAQEDDASQPALRAQERVAGETQLRPDGVAFGAGASRSASSTPEPAIEPLAAGRYRVQFTASRDLRDKLERLRSLLRPTVPDGDFATVIERAVTEAIDRIEARRFGKARRLLQASAPDPKTGSRRVPASVRRAVVERDGLRCAFVDRSGRRCSERARLEFHHRHPFGMGGDHRTENIGLVCRAHNAWLAECDFGRSAIRRHSSSECTAGRNGPVGAT